MDTPTVHPNPLTMSSPTETLDPSLGAHWQDSSQLTRPNTAIEPIHSNWQYSPGLQLGDTLKSESVQNWLRGKLQENDPNQLVSEAEADFRQQVQAHDAASQLQRRSEYAFSHGPDSRYAGETSQSKPSAADDLFSEMDDTERADIHTYNEDEDLFEMTGVGQTPQISKQPSNPAFLATRPVNQTPLQHSVTEMQEFADPAIQPSPTESQLVAEGFEFHNQSPEEVQINRFNDKAFRKALREVQSDLPRKQQWYAWSKAKQMLNGEPYYPETATEQTNKILRNPPEFTEVVEEQVEFEEIFYEEEVPKPKYGADREAFTGSCTSKPQIIEGIRDPLSLAESHSTTNARKSGDHSGNACTTSGDSISHITRGNTPSSPASTGGFAMGPKEAKLDFVAVKIEEQRNEAPSVNDNTTESFSQQFDSYPRSSSGQDCSSISANEEAEVKANKAAELHSLRTELETVGKEALTKLKERVKANMLTRRDGSAHGLLALSNASEHSQSLDEVEHTPIMTSKSSGPTSAPRSIQNPASTETNPAPLPPNPVLSNCSCQPSNTTQYSADLLRPHTNTLLRRSLSPSSQPSRGHLPPPLSPNRCQRSPSPWIEHPGINRPDTPRPIPSRTTSPNRDIRQSVERSSPLSDQLSRLRGVRESTPAYEERSPSPSPVSQLGAKVAAVVHAQHNAVPDGLVEMKHSDDTEMIDAPSLPTPIKPVNHPCAAARSQYEFAIATSSPDPLSSPLHGVPNNAGYSTAPQTPHHLQTAQQGHAGSPHPSTYPKPPPIPQSPSPLKPGKTRRKSIGGQTTGTSNSSTTGAGTPKSRAKSQHARNITSVQGASISKQRTATTAAASGSACTFTSTSAAGAGKPAATHRRVTQIAQKVKKLKEVEKAERAMERANAAIGMAVETGPTGSKVAQAVRKIEAGILRAVGGGDGEGGWPPRRSGRLALKQARRG